MTLRVGDIVTVGRGSGVNAPGAMAVVVEEYRIGDRPGWMLLFADGQADGFSPAHCLAFDVRPAGHAADVAGYQFTNVTRLHADWRRGRFDSVFSRQPKGRVQ